MTVGVWGMVGVCGTGGVNGTAAGGTMTAGAAGIGAFPPPDAGAPWLAHAHPHMPQKLHLFGTRARHVGRPHTQPPRGDERGEERGGGICAGCVAAESSAA